MSKKSGYQRKTKFNPKLNKKEQKIQSLMTQSIKPLTKSEQGLPVVRRSLSNSKNDGDYEWLVPYCIKLQLQQMKYLKSLLYWNNIVEKQPKNEDALLHKEYYEKMFYDKESHVENTINLYQKHINLDVKEQLVDIKIDPSSLEFEDILQFNLFKFQKLEQKTLQRFLPQLDVSDEETQEK